MVGDECMKVLKIYVCLTCPIITLCLIFNILGITTFSYTGFAVDSCGIVFIGKDSIIEKYFDGKKIAELDPKTSRGYAFTIQNDNIILSTGSFVYTLDLDGKELGREADIETKVFNGLQKQKKFFVTNEGDQYYFKSVLGRAQVIDESGNVLYKMPFLDYIVKLLFISSLISIFVCVPLIIRATLKQGTVD